MPPAASKANYKSYEAQARMVRAIVAAHPEVKWNYKDIVACYGSDMTEHALNHRFRRLRAEAVIIKEGRGQGLDMKYLPFEGDLPKNQGEVDTKNIAKYFGQSTADGIQFQFRTFKRDAEKLRKVSNTGGDVASALNAELNGPTSSATVTPSKTPSRRGGQSTAKRSRPNPDDEISFIKSEIISDDDDDDAPEPSDREEPTPSKRPKTNGRTPLPPRQVPAVSGAPRHTPAVGLTVRRAAAASASATITAEAATSAQSDDSDPFPEIETPTSSAPVANPTPVRASIFGDVSRKPARQAAVDDDASNPFTSAFRSNGFDAYLGSQSHDPSASMHAEYGASFRDGEI